MTSDSHDEHPGDVPPRDPDPETEGGNPGGGTSSGGSDSGGGAPGDDAATHAEDPSSPEAIQDDPSTAGGPNGDVPDEIDRLRGG